MADPHTFLQDLESWARGRTDVVAVALVGSHARGTARLDSDVDVVILAEDPRVYLEDTAWIRYFGDGTEPALEDYGLVQSLRVTYAGGLEVEFGLTSPEWASVETLDNGTREVVADGCRIVLDPHGVLAALLRAAA